MSNVQTPVCEECLDSPVFKPTFSGMGQSPSASLHLRVKWVDDYNTAFSMVLGWVMSNRPKFKNLVPSSMNVQPIEGTNCWDVNVEYGFKKAELNVVLDYKFTTTGNTSHITRSVETVVSKSCVGGLPAINFGGAIGVSADSGGIDIAGVDIKTPTFGWTQSQAYNPKFVNAGFLQRLASFTGKVNSAPFKGFAAGEVLFDGISDGSLQYTTDDETGDVFWYYKITFQFSCAPNVYGIQVGDAVVDKWGWEYMWILWETIVQGKNTTKYPRNVCIEQVYQTADLNALGVLDIY